MTGTILNVGAIVLGGTLGLSLGRGLSEKAQLRIKLGLGLFTIWVGFSTTWDAIGGSFGRVVKQILIVCLALVLGNALGKLLKIQKRLNRLGEYARQQWQKSHQGSTRFAEGFVTASLLFCVGPMAIIGALQDALNDNYRILGIKSVMDGLATMAFVKTFGWGVILSAVPVLAYQGTITLGAEFLRPYFEQRAMLDALNATGGLLIVCASVMILDIAKVPLADYLPALIVAPLLAWWWM
jgi:uncharacterized protein